MLRPAGSEERTRAGWTGAYLDLRGTQCGVPAGAARLPATLHHTNVLPGPEPLPGHILGQTFGRLCGKHAQAAPTPFC